VPEDGDLFVRQRTFDAIGVVPKAIVLLFVLFVVLVAELLIALRLSLVRLRLEKVAGEEFDCRFGEVLCVKRVDLGL
jgi:hypothetical protein